MSIKRFLTGIIGFPIVALLLIYGNKYIISALLSIIAIISMNEYIKCVSTKINVIKWICYACSLLVGIIPLFPSVLYIELGIPILLLILFFSVIATNMKITFEDISYTLMGIVYIVGLLVFFPLTYNYEGAISGKILIWFILSSAWGTDVFAYLFGMKIGKTKFSKVSPKKSVEGCVSGTIGAIIITLIITWGFNKYIGLDISYIKIGMIALLLSIIGQIGDFAASVIKRSFDIKDFSELFPGHGGMIDRIDSVMFIAPFAYLLLTHFI